ncbi:MAG: HAMP domain-containing protein [Proteobacteria bacterium]|nr:HAMP domain-containing protein [Pseudomonadota bacterium]MBU1059104.1 HAMP domain-containing protein [Pseudomonadota bacterium]
MSVRKKILIFATTFLILLSLGIFTAVTNHHFIQRFHNEMESIAILQKQCSDIKCAIEDTIMIPHDYLILGDEKGKNDFSLSIERVRENINNLKQLLLSSGEEYSSDIFKSFPDSYQRVSVLEKDLLEFERIVADIFALQQPQSNEAAASLMISLDAFGQEIKDKIAGENTIFIDLLHQNLKALSEREHLLYVKVQFMESIILLIGLLLSFYLYQSIIRPVNHLLKVTRAIGAGNMSARVELSSVDEFGELGRSFNHMLEELTITYERLNSIFQGSGDAMRVIDKNFTVLQVNNEMAAFCTIPFAENKGMKCYEQFSSKHCHSETCTLRQMLDGKKRVQSETVKQTTSGKLIPVEMVATPFSVAGKIVGVIESFRDISERITAEKDKEYLQAQLLHAQKLESVGRLAAGIAHEINTPTQYIGTNIDFMAEAVGEINELIGRIREISKNAPAEIMKAIDEALEKADWEYLAEELPQAIAQSKDGIKRVSSIVLAMKEFSHPGSKEKELYDLNQIIKTTVTVACNEWKYVSDVELDLEQNLPKIQLLADEMGQVILNMLINAVHTIEERLVDTPDGKKGTITIRTKQLDRSIEIRISDTGNGIPEENQSHIFEPFYTTKKVGKGSGQGLAICHDVVVDKHGGSIEFETEVGKGTHFIIRLPL